MQPSPIIVKVGGSLYDLPDLGPRLSAWLSARGADIPVCQRGEAAHRVEGLRQIEADVAISACAAAPHGRQECLSHEVILVPGGGPLVEALRRLDQVHLLGEEACHWLALRTLTINAHFLAHLLPGANVVDPTQRAGTVSIMDMYEFNLADEARPGRLPHSWDVTSDSLAVRVAILAGARKLVLLKSVGQEEPLLALRNHEEIVDRYFAEALSQAPAELTVEIVNLRAWAGITADHE